MLRTIITLLLLLPFIAVAQPDVFFKQKLGKDLITNEDITGIVLALPDLIENVYLDVPNNALCIMVRGLDENKQPKVRGEYIYYDLATNKVKWTKKLNLNAGSIVNLNGFIIYTRNYKSCLLDPENGKEGKTVYNIAMAGNKGSGIVAGYERHDPESGRYNTLRGMRMTDGSIIWERELNWTGYWNDTYNINDTTILIASSGLHTLNIGNGKGWDYDMKTTRNGHIGGFSSNILIDNDQIYLAGTEKIACVTHEGRPVWATALPIASVSNSKIFINDNLVYMINKGTGLTYPLGQPFVAAFNKNTGEQVFIKMLDASKGWIMDAEYNSGEIALLFNNSIVRLKTSDLSLKEVKLSLPKYVFPINITSKIIYAPVGNKYLPLTKSDSNNIHFTTNTYETYSVNQNMQVSEYLDYKSSYLFINFYKNHQFIRGNKKTVVLTRDNNPVAEFKPFYPVRVVDKTLYATNEDLLYIIDMKNVLTD